MAKYEVAWKEYHHSVVEAISEDNAIYKTMEWGKMKKGKKIYSTYEYANLRYCRKVINEKRSG